MRQKRISTQADLVTETKKITDKLNATISSMDVSKGEKLLSWLSTWEDKYLKWEDEFDPTKLKSYERGHAVYANFGYNLMHELGGIHYAIVIENENGNNCGSVVVVPLRSLKDDEDENSLDEHEAFLGYGIFKDEIKRVENQIKNYEKEIDNLIKNAGDEELIKKNKALKRKDELFKTDLERGSVAKISQIRSISKMRIFYPRNSEQPLATFKLNSEQFEILNQKIVKYYLKSD